MAVGALSASPGKHSCLPASDVDSSAEIVAMSVGATHSARRAQRWYYASVTHEAPPRFDDVYAIVV